VPLNRVYLRTLSSVRSSRPRRPISSPVLKLCRITRMSSSRMGGSWSAPIGSARGRVSGKRERRAIHSHRKCGFYPDGPRAEHTAGRARQDSLANTNQIAPAS
jgi:hypothetical protein